MRIELLTTGDELVTGQIVDTNSPWIMDRLFALGEVVARKVAVGDDVDEIAAALREAASRAELVVVSGGLGPTLDDLTVDAACAAFGRTPRVDEAQLARIRARFAAAGREMSPNNERQARVPGGARVLGNDFGSATAFALSERGGACELTFVPGVPRELEALLDAHLFPALRARLEAAGAFRAYREVRCAFIYESHMDEAVRPLLPRHPHVRYGTRTSYPENHVKLLAEGASAAEADARADAAAAEIAAALGDAVYGATGVSFAAATLAALKARGLTVSFAESLTAGLAAATLAEVPGASAALRGAQVVYAEALKTRWLGVPEPLLARHGAVSAEVAAAMAEGALASSGADLAASVTGWADGGAPGAVPGLVYAAIAGGGLPTRVVERRLLHGRPQVRRGAAWLALDLVRRRALGRER